jgi:protein translocase SecG subunit
MLTFFLKIISCLLILLIVYRIPEKDGGSMNPDITRSFFGSKRNGSIILDKLTWFLVILFFLFNSLIVILKL